MIMIGNRLYLKLLWTAAEAATTSAYGRMIRLESVEFGPPVCV